MIKVGVGSVITLNNQFLLIKRAPKLGQGTWSTPGGRLEEGELPEKCAAREAMEEVGYPGNAFEFLGLTNDLFEGHHYITIWMRAICDGAWNIKCSSEVLEYGWFALDELPAPLFHPFANLLMGRCYETNSKLRRLQ